MFKKLFTCLGGRESAPNGVSKSALAAPRYGQGISEWHRQQLQHNREWMRDFWSDKFMRTGTSNPKATSLAPPEELEPHWYIVKYLCRWSRTHYETAPQAVIDRAVAESLGISRTHAVLMREGILNERPIWPDTLIERDGSYPWATPEIHAFWSLLDSMSEEQLNLIGQAAAERKEELKRCWREVHRIVTAHHPDYSMVLYRAAATPIHPCAPQYIDDLHQAKTRATFELTAASLVVDPLSCRNLALFGFKTPADLLEQGEGAACQSPEAGQ